jgi:hypothetical protein
MPAKDVDDGYTEEEVIPKTSRYPRTWIRFRPMLRGERQRLLTRGIAAAQQQQAATTEEMRTIADASTLAATHEVARSLDRHLIDWDRTDRKTGDKIPVSVEAIERLPGPLFERIYNAVALFGEKPDQPGPPGPGQPDGALSQQDETAKNSAAGPV